MKTRLLKTVRATLVSSVVGVMALTVGACADDDYDCTQPARLGVNLVSNGGAEFLPSDNTGSTFNPFGDDDSEKSAAEEIPSCWERTEGCFAAGAYVGIGGITKPVNGGERLFTGGTPCDVSPEFSVGVQVIDADTLSPIESDIASGGLTYDLSAELGGWKSQEDAATVIVTFMDNTGQTLDTAEIGPVTADERNNEIAFVSRSTSGAVPKDTAAVEIRLEANRTEGNNNDGYADNIALVFN